MGASYFVFMEIYKDGKWQCINNYSGTELIPVFESGSRSYFSRSFEKMQEIGNVPEYNTLSEDVKTFIHPQGDKLPSGWCMCAVPMEAMKKNIPAVHENNYYVLKNDIFLYETEGEEVESAITLEEYRTLGEEEKKSYSFYEWDDECGYTCNFKKILEHAKWLLWEYRYVHYFAEEENIRFVALSC